MYKILFVRNRFTGPLDFSTGLNWLKTHTPLNIVVEEISTDFDVTTKSVNNSTYHGVVCGDDIYPKLRSVIPEGKYNCVVLIAGNDLNGLRVFGYAGGESLYYGTDLIQLFKTEDKGMVLNHEMFHTFINRLRRQQIGVEDPMDYVVYDGILQPYFHDSDLDAVPSNRSIALERISPYWDKIINIPFLNAPVPPPSTSPYKWFSAKEVARWKLDPKLWKFLDDARDKAGTPFIITSGLRTAQENINVGGKPNSAHLRGLAADLLCTDNFKRKALLGSILSSTACFVEIAKGHIHVDLDPSIHTLGQVIVSNDD